MNGGHTPALFLLSQVIYRGGPPEPHGFSATVDFYQALTDALTGVLTFILTAVVWGIYRRLKAIQKQFERIPLLEKQLHLLIRVLGDRDPKFKDMWNKYARNIDGVDELDGKL